MSLGDSHLRSLAKAYSWRIVATLTTALIAYQVTGEMDTAIAIGGIEFVVKFFINYAHEHAWQFVPRRTLPSALHAFRHSPE